MTLELTEQQRAVLTNVANSPVSVIDRTTNTMYLLVRSDIYQRIQSLLENEPTTSMEPLPADLSPEDWEDLANYEQRP